MKKIISMVLTLVLTLSMAIPASATTYVIPGNDDGGNLNDDSSYDESSKEETPAIEFDSLKLPPVVKSTEHNRAPELPLFTGVKLLPLGGISGIVIDGCAKGYYHITDTKTGKWGLVDSDEDMTDIFPPIYDSIYVIDNNTFEVEKDGKTIWIDKSGKFIKNVDYSADESEYGKNITKNGFEYISPTKIPNVFTGSIGTYPNRKTCFVDVNGNILYPEPIVTYEFNEWTNDQYLVVTLENGRFQVLDKKLALVYECSPDADYARVDEFGNCCEQLKNLKDWRYVNLSDGKSFVTSGDAFFGFSETGAAVTGNCLNPLSLINKNGDALIPSSKGYTSFSVSVTRTGVPIAVAVKGNTSDIYQLIK